MMENLLGIFEDDAAIYAQFTDRARKVMELSNQEAQRFNHEYIGTEHVLLGLVKEGAAYFPHICLAISAHFGLSDTVTWRLAGGRASRRVAPVNVH
jgi:hypothetical protein